VKPTVIYPDTANLIAISNGVFGEVDDFLEELPENIRWVFSPYHPADLCFATPEEQERITRLISDWPLDRKRCLYPDGFAEVFPPHDEFVEVTRNPEVVRTRTLMSMGHALSRSAASGREEHFVDRGVGRDLNQGLRQAQAPIPQLVADFQALRTDMDEKQWLRMCLRMLDEQLQSIPGVAEILKGVPEDASPAALREAVRAVHQLMGRHFEQRLPFQLMDLRAAVEGQSRPDRNRPSDTTDMGHLSLVWKFWDEFDLVFVDEDKFNQIWWSHRTGGMPRETPTKLRKNGDFRKTLRELGMSV